MKQAISKALAATIMVLAVAGCEQSWRSPSQAEIDLAKEHGKIYARNLCLTFPDTCVAPPTVYNVESMKMEAEIFGYEHNSLQLAFYVGYKKEIVDEKARRAAAGR